MADKARMKAALRPIDLDKMRKKFRVSKAVACIAIDLDGSTLRAVKTAPRGDSFVVSRILAEPLELPPDPDRNDPAVIGRAIDTEARLYLGQRDGLFRRRRDKFQAHRSGLGVL